MPEQLSHYWYAFLAASPTPETGEAVNIGLVIGNGKAFSLEYEPHLPRLAGLVAADQRHVYEAILAPLKERIAASGGVPEAELRAMLGSQLRLQSRRALLHEPNQRVLKILRAHYLQTPDIPYRTAVTRLRAQAGRRLDEAIDQVRPRHVHVSKSVTFKKLYEQKLERFVEFNVPPIARALRSERRDLLMDSILIDAAHLKYAARQPASRISRAFFGYRKIEGVIRRQTGKEIRLVGILHPGSPDDSADVRETREWIKHIWEKDATRVIDGNEIDVAAALREDAEWVRQSA